LSRPRDIIEGAISSPSVFRNKDKLYPEYIPRRLPHREEQLKQLALIFKDLLLDPGSAPHRAFLVGGVGTGKTVTSRVFGGSIMDLAEKRNVKLRYVHVNCHRDRTLYSVVSEIARQLKLPLPTRGLSAQEIMAYILEYLDERNMHVIIALDEFDYFARLAGSDAIYFLVRTYDEYPWKAKRLNFIFISRDSSSLGMLDPATQSYLVRSTVRFPPYSSRELYDILMDRVAEAFYPGVVDEEVVRYIADIEGSEHRNGNARVALEILLIAGEIADREEAGRVTVEHVRKANTIVNPEITVLYDTLKYLPLHELLFMFAAVRVLREREKAYARIGEIEAEYRRLCEHLGLKPRRHTQIYEYVVELRRIGVIDTRTSGKGYRGKSTLVAVNAGPLDHLERKLFELISSKGGVWG